uniref:SCAN box domain-containing protein n=1 Tax=Terrapene triunguis TaxID=2587831 RepID=A0A674I2G6_9SAUR
GRCLPKKLAERDVLEDAGLCLPRQVQETHCSDVSEAEHYAEMCRYRFREYRFQETKGPQKAYAQLSELCHKWIQPKSKSAAWIADLLIIEQFLEILPHDVQTWVRRNRPDTGSKAVSLAEYFLAIKEHAQCSKLVRPPECPVREKCRAGKAGSGIMTSRTTNALSEEKLGSLHTWSHTPEHVLHCGWRGGDWLRCSHPCDTCGNPGLPHFLLHCSLFYDSNIYVNSFLMSSAVLLFSIFHQVVSSQGRI